MVPCSNIAENLGSLFHCKEMNGFVRIRTPLTYPDGDYVDIFWDPQFSRLTDLGETLRWLRMQSYNYSRTVRQQELIKDTCTNNRVQFESGCLMINGVADQKFAASVVNLAQTCVRVSDVYFTYRNRTIVTLCDELADYLDESNVAYERNAKVVGVTGRSNTIDFRLPKANALMQVLTTASRAATGRVLDHAVRVWSDIRQSVTRDGGKLITVFDDTNDVWTEGDFELLQEYSSVVNWSEPANLLDVIAA